MCIRDRVDYPSPTSSEFTRSWGLNAIGVQTAWARGAYGNGISVGVVDTGVDPNACLLYTSRCV